MSFYTTMLTSQIMKHKGRLRNYQKSEEAKETQVLNTRVILGHKKGGNKIIDEVQVIYS